MLLEQEVEMKWHPSNRKWYECKGYNFTNWKESFMVNVIHLKEGSHAEVLVRCDYCSNVIPKQYKKYIDQRKKIKTDSCIKCNHLKASVTVEEKYGTKYYLQTNECRVKSESTCIEKYGVRNPAMSDIVKEKYKSTMQEMYGVDNAFQSEVIKDKSKQTMLKKYGFENLALDPKTHRKWMIKRSKTLASKNNAPCSSQQRFIHNAIKGELNYPVSNLNLDIAFPEDKIYIECDFSGHDMRVRMGDIDLETFKQNERNRDLFLKNKGWKRIRFVSKNDLLPSVKQTVELIFKGINLLKNTERNWCEINIDESVFRYNTYEESLDLHSLIKVTSKNISKIFT